MNAESVAKLKTAYLTGLKEAIAMNPDMYALRGESTDTFAERVTRLTFERICSGKYYDVSYDSPGFKLACKQLGIKPTRKAILSFLEITT